MYHGYRVWWQLQCESISRDIHISLLRLHVFFSIEGIYCLDVLASDKKYPAGACQISMRILYCDRDTVSQMLVDDVY